MKFFILSATLLAITFFSGCQPDPVEENLKAPVANAGSSAAIQLPASTVTLTGSGTTTNGHITGYLWSLVSGPNVPVIVSPSSPATVINSMIAGTYIFQFMVIDDAGLSDVDTASVVVTAAVIVPQTVTFQPANSSENELSIAGNSNGLNLTGHPISITGEAWTMGGAPLFIRSSLKFDLASIPSSATITSAKLSLYSNPTPINGDQINANSGTSNALYLRRITSNWTSATTSWQNQPTATTTDQVSIPQTNLGFQDVTDIDVTTLINAMRTSGNYGFMLQLQNEVTYNTRQFCSSYHSVAAKRPKLVVVYQ